jgi:ParB family chromosome partitioning protein
MSPKRDLKVHLIPVDQIIIINTRSRGQEKFRQIVSNISNIGLKKPITVTPRKGRDGETKYDLVCGQGRLEAFKALGQTEVPALVVDVSREELLLMSLIENLARRQHSSLELCRRIVAMKNDGQKIQEIAAKVDLDPTYIRGMIRLLEHGEERLLSAVEQRRIPLSIAIMIAQTEDREVERAITELYDRGELKGKALFQARAIIARRKGAGKGWRDQPEAGEKVTPNSLLKAYQRETARQQFLLNRATISESRLRFIVTAMKRLLADEGFVNLLRAESMVSLPKSLADLVSGKETKNVA